MATKKTAKGKTAKGKKAALVEAKVKTRADATRSEGEAFDNETSEICKKIEELALPGDLMRCFEKITDMLDGGGFGPWHVDDGRLIQSISGKVLAENVHPCIADAIQDVPYVGDLAAAAIALSGEAEAAAGDAYAIFEKASGVYSELAGEQEKTIGLEDDLDAAVKRADRAEDEINDARRTLVEVFGLSGAVELTETVEGAKERYLGALEEAAMSASLRDELADAQSRAEKWALHAGIATGRLSQAWNGLARLRDLLQSEERVTRGALVAAIEPIGKVLAAAQDALTEPLGEG